MTKINKCSICGAELKVKKITYTQNIGDKVYIITDVPAQVCNQCGEEYLSPDTVDALQEIIEKGPTKVKAHKTIEVPIYHFPA